MKKQQNDDSRYRVPATPMMPPCIYSPGTVYNPIAVPPWAGMQPGFPPTGGQPVTQPPAILPPTTRQPVDFAPEPGPPVMRGNDYIQGQLKDFIGRPVKVEFILGTNMLIDKEGTLLDVGIDHIVLRETRTDDILLADLYSIKFVTILL
ncbi:hypothetical protein [Proteiniborus sp.]|uniref:hypothetical protein n=1 Tax=Proteiniborus sp. TaxID=2079015 RepID=UPI00332FB3E5